MARPACAVSSGPGAPVTRGRNNHPVIRFPRIGSIIGTRPRLWSSAAFGVAVFLLLPMALGVQAESRVLVAWNAGALLYLALALQMTWDSDADDVQRRARIESEGRGLVLALVVGAAVAVLLAVGSQMAAIKDLRGAARAPHVAMVVLTVCTSWLFTQALFMLHYAHEFYAARLVKEPDPLAFPGTQEPNYSDFFYFACVIGTSGQTADVPFNGARLRGVGTLHCILAFAFNTTVLALTINIAASLF